MRRDGPPTSAMIFAAGLGTRMGALTRDRPKPLIPVAGQTLLDHALAIVRAAGVSRIVVNTHAHSDQIAAHLRAVAPDVRISHEPERLETGGGLKAALPLFAGETVFTLNADMIWRGPNPLAALAAAWDPGRMSVLLVLVPRVAAIGHDGPGDFDIDATGGVRRRTGAAADHIFAGAQIIDTRLLAPFEPGRFSLNRVWDDVLAAGILHGLPWHGTWVDVGRPEGIALAEAELAR